MHFQLHLLIFSPSHLFSVPPSCFQPHSLVSGPCQCIFSCTLSFAVPPTCFQLHSLVSGPVHAFSAALAHFQSLLLVSQQHDTIIWTIM
ncbi:hypothetical protein PAXRUDRAFT_172608 [Paxillus rubicundulus Ve08.2h10]|uniref:Secreted protein n=1 Tax=Paxillus rubicundulus Ve08.2h10 TaxID=930991 RepID=A0A0D0DDN6_9AGAM|nr:hypothetical protein PAXRUDRAFT_172608 [Paxillus rubicundulus Ve08.2h10]